MRFLETIPYNGDGSMSFRINECSICMEGYSPNETVYRVPNCMHMFHEDCMRNWLLSKNQEHEQRCPFCNQQMNYVELRDKMQTRGTN